MDWFIKTRLLESFTSATVLPRLSISTKEVKGMWILQIVWSNHYKHNKPSSFLLFGFLISYSKLNGIIFFRAASTLLWACTSLLKSRKFTPTPAIVDILLSIIGILSSLFLKSYLYLRGQIKSFSTWAGKVIIKMIQSLRFLYQPTAPPDQTEYYTPSVKRLLSVWYWA